MGRTLDTLTSLRQYDPSGMCDRIRSFPGQCRSAAAIGAMAYLPRGYARSCASIVAAGMGGSAIGADIARAYLAGMLDVPFVVNRDYLLPAFVDQRTLLFVSSYSGNTEETLSAYRDGKRRRAKVVVITSGGKLQKLAERADDPAILIPPGMPPRAALGYSFFPLLVTLARLGCIPDQTAAIARTIVHLERLCEEEVGPLVPAAHNSAKRIARTLQGRLPVVYAAQTHIDAVATRWRGQLAENAKTLASVNLFPEMNHNEIMGWEHPAPVIRRSAAVFLRDASDHPRVARRMDVTRAILKKEGVDVIDVRSSGTLLLERIFSLIYTGDFVSLYLAALDRVDPTAIARIDYLKKELARS